MCAQQWKNFHTEKLEVKSQFGAAPGPILNRIQHCDVCSKFVFFLLGKQLPGWCCNSAIIMFHCLRQTLGAVCLHLPIFDCLQLHNAKKWQCYGSSPFLRISACCSQSLMWTLHALLFRVKTMEIQMTSFKAHAEELASACCATPWATSQIYDSHVLAPLPTIAPKQTKFYK